VDLHPRERGEDRIESPFDSEVLGEQVEINAIMRDVAFVDCARYRRLVVHRRIKGLMRNGEDNPSMLND